MNARTSIVTTLADGVLINGGGLRLCYLLLPTTLGCAEGEIGHAYLDPLHSLYTPSYPCRTRIIAAIYVLHHITIPAMHSDSVQPLRLYLIRAVTA